MHSALMHAHRSCPPKDRDKVRLCKCMMQWTMHLYTRATTAPYSYTHEGKYLGPVGCSSIEWDAPHLPRQRLDAPERYNKRIGILTQVYVHVKELSSNCWSDMVSGGSRNSERWFSHWRTKYTRNFWVATPISSHVNASWYTQLLSDLSMKLEKVTCLALETENDDRNNPKLLYNKHKLLLLVV